MAEGLERFALEALLAVMDHFVICESAAEYRSAMEGFCGEWGGEAQPA